MYYEWHLKTIGELLDRGCTLEEIRKADICENGQVHWNQGFFDITEPNYVTPLSVHEAMQEADDEAFL